MSKKRKPQRLKSIEQSRQTKEGEVVDREGNQGHDDQVDGDARLSNVSFEMRLPEAVFLFGCESECEKFVEHVISLLERRCSRCVQTRA